jgi:superfamily II DNA/RNA helicase
MRKRFAADIDRDEEDKPQAPRWNQPFVTYQYNPKDHFAEITFESMGLHERLVKHMREHMGIEKPTHIQQAAIPRLLKDEDAYV